LSTLEEAGYIRIERPVSDRRRRYTPPTSAGQAAFDGHVAAARHRGNGERTSPSDDV
jgi:DNA-binding MarR family transcriptional regulator